MSGEGLAQPPAPQDISGIEAVINKFAELLKKGREPFLQLEFDPDGKGTWFLEAKLEGRKTETTYAEKLDLDTVAKIIDKALDIALPKMVEILEKKLETWSKYSRRASQTTKYKGVLIFVSTDGYIYGVAFNDKTIYLRELGSLDIGPQEKYIDFQVIYWKEGSSFTDNLPRHAVPLYVKIGDKAHRVPVKEILFEFYIDEELPEL